MKTISLCLLLLGAASAQERRPETSLRGIRIGESQAEVKQALAKSADLQREEEGQQVWKLRSDADADFVLVGYDTEHRIRYVTLVAKKDRSLRCDVLGDIAKAQSEGKPGNMHFSAPVGDRDENIIAVARGESADHINFCSLKRVGAKTEEDEEEAREHRERKH
ncbi:MAG: hypothetical protein NVS9B15_14830 [Acidobacteriaceae bacterium]